MLPVTLYGPNGSLIVNALINKGSDTMFLLERILKKIGVTKLTVNGASGSVELGFKIIHVDIRGSIGGRAQVRVHSLPNVCLALSGTSWIQIKGHWRHLGDLKLSHREGKVEMLIDLDNGHLIEPLESSRGSVGDPYAFQTQLSRVCRG